MPVDDALVGQAREAEARVAAAEAALDLAKADHRHAIRRLHLAGASLREIAAALDLSHQRVHQIIDTTGGARRWLKKSPPKVLACSFCGRPPRAVKKLVNGPGVYICDQCVAMAERVATTGQRAENRRTTMAALPVNQPAARCSFCGRRRRDVPALVAGPDDRICARCLQICQEINAEELQ
jgi:ClpX C4-type zinc finger